LVNPDNHDLDAPALWFGALGSHGFAHYYEVCEFLAKPGTAVQWDPESKVPYAFNEGDWVSYDNEDSVQEKVCFLLLLHS
jgi:GH18 family chitinase